MRDHAKLSVVGLGGAMGILYGLCMLVSSLLATYYGLGLDMIALMGQMYKGYDATLAGAFIGLVWGLVDGFICGALLAWLYNFLSGHPACKSNGCEDDHCCGSDSTSGCDQSKCGCGGNNACGCDK